MTTHEAIKRDDIKTVLENEKRNRKRTSRTHQKLCEKIFQNTKYRTDATLYDLSTITESPRWFWASYPV